MGLHICVSIDHSIAHSWQGLGGSVEKKHFLLSQNVDVNYVCRWEGSKSYQDTLILTHNFHFFKEVFQVVIGLSFLIRNERALWSKLKSRNELKFSD